jgi:predicted adenylyl cyclase CyaB
MALFMDYLSKSRAWPQPGRNVEQKFHCGNHADAHAAALAAGAQATDVLLQRDVYFHAVSGRLKLRSIQSERSPPTAELIAYDRPDGAGERISTYILVRVADPGRLEAALGAALGVRAVVKKRRRLLMSGNIRLHFDEVESLGTFVEFEAVLGDGDTEAQSIERIARWRSVLGLSDAVSRSYVDLLEARVDRPSVSKISHAR